MSAPSHFGVLAPARRDAARSRFGAVAWLLLAGGCTYGVVQTLLLRLV